MKNSPIRLILGREGVRKRTISAMRYDAIPHSSQRERKALDSTSFLHYLDLCGGCLARAVCRLRPQVPSGRHKLAERNMHLRSKTHSGGQSGSLAGIAVLEPHGRKYVTECAG